MHFASFLGLQTANSWTRDNITANNFLANGGTELNPTSSLYDLEFRNYDPILGRMNQVDPMASRYASYTPYNYSFNSPVVWNDVNGADPGGGTDAAMAREEKAQRDARQRLGDAVTISNECGLAP